MSEDVRKRIGAMLRALREERGFSLGHVQHLTHDIDWPISRSRLSQLERGEVEVHLSDLYPLSRTYGFSIGSLISEAIIAHSKKKFAKGLTADELFEQAKELFRIGKPLEAAWTFDEAGRRAEDGKTDFRHLCMISAGHCYERLDAYDLALKRVELVIDGADPHSEIYFRAAAKALMIRSRVGSMGRARLYSEIVNERLSRRCPADLKALLLSALGEHLYRSGDLNAASSRMKESARLFLKLGNHAMSAKMHGVAAHYLLRETPPAAKPALKLATTGLSLLSDAEHQEARLSVLRSLGEALLKLSRYSEAGPHLLEACKIAQKLGFDDDLRLARDLLSQVASLVEDEPLARRWAAASRSSRRQSTELSRESRPRATRGEST